jgi:Ca2+-binding RTX toxin-like protein
MGKGNGKGGGNSGGGSGSEWNSVSSKRGIELTGTDGKDIITGNDRDNILHGLGDTDRLIGGDGDDTLWGGSGDDSLHGGNGDDFLYGEADDDWLQGGAGSDLMDGGGGYDIAAFVEIARSTPEGGGLQITVTGYDSDNNASGYTVFNPGTGDTDTVLNVEQIIGSNYDDLMTGGTGNDHLIGARGNDSLIGDAGDDILYGSLDDDSIDAGENAGSGNDTLVFLRYMNYGTAYGDGNDVVTGFDPANDTILFFGDVSDEGDITEQNVGADLLITYATDSSILLLGQAGAAIMYEFDPMAV